MTPRKCIQTSIAEHRTGERIRQIPYELQFNRPIRDKLPVPPPSRAQNTPVKTSETNRSHIQTTNEKVF